MPKGKGSMPGARKLQQSAARFRAGARTRSEAVAVLVVVEGSLRVAPLASDNGRDLELVGHLEKVISQTRDFHVDHSSSRRRKHNPPHRPLGLALGPRDHEALGRLQTWMGATSTALQVSYRARAVGEEPSHRAISSLLTALGSQRSRQSVGSITHRLLRRLVVRWFPVSDMAENGLALSAVLDQVKVQKDRTQPRVIGVESPPTLPPVPLPEPTLKHAELTLRAIREHIRPLVEPLRANLEVFSGHNFGSFEANQSFVAMANEMADSVGLRFKCQKPGCGAPSTLYLRTSNSPTGSFAFRHAEEGVSTFHLARAAVPPLVLIQPKKP